MSSIDVDRDADAADLAARQRVVGVAPHLRRQIERDREPGLPLREQVACSARFDSAAVPKPAYWRIVQSRPRYMRRLDAARERELARAARGRAPRRTAAARRSGVAGVVDRRRAGCRRRRSSTVLRVASLTRRRSPGRRRATISVGSVFAWISSTETPGARSRSDEARPGVTSMHREVGDDPVHRADRRSAAACSASRIFFSSALGDVLHHHDHPLGGRRPDPSRRPSP